MSEREIVFDPNVPQGLGVWLESLSAIAIGRPIDHVFINPADYVCIRVTIAGLDGEITYERAQTMRERLRFERRRRKLRGTPVSTWPELAAWAGVPA